MAEAPTLVPGATLPGSVVIAHNSATQSENKIHDDDVARKYGFAGGLVPGVTDFAYMVAPAFAALGERWLQAGRMAARFFKPVYEGERTEIRARVDPSDATRVLLELLNPDGAICASGSASLDDSQVAPSLADFPQVALPAERPPVSYEVLAAVDVLGTVEGENTVESNQKFLDEIQDENPTWRRPGAPTHPGYLIRWANSALAQNVRLNPWIHVSSDCQLLGILAVGQPFEARSRVTELFERKGHKFVRLDVLIADKAERPLMRVDHVAIYDIRPAEGS